MKIKPLTTRLNALPQNEQLSFLQKLESTIALGLRALILRNLKEEDRAEFEKVTQSGGDDQFFIFAKNHIPNFEKEYFNLMTEIYQKISL